MPRSTISPSSTSPNSGSRASAIDAAARAAAQGRQLALRGTPRGREGLIWDLQDAMIVYTPEQLITLANNEFAWCESEMKKASREMGFGDDWKKALEKTKKTARAAGRPAAHDYGPAGRGRRLPRAPTT